MLGYRKTTVDVGEGGSKHKAELPRGPRVYLPVVGNTWEFLTSAWKTVERIVQVHGNAAFVSLLGQNVVAFYDPQLVTRNGAFPFNFRRLAGGEILPMLDGPLHTNRREVINASVWNEALMPRQVAVVREVDEAFLAEWSRQGPGLSMAHELRLWSSELAGRLLLGEDGLGKWLLSHVDSVLAGFTSVPINIPWLTAYSKATRSVDEMVQKITREFEARAVARGAYVNRVDAVSVLADLLAHGALTTRAGLVTEVHHMVLAMASLVGNLAATILLQGSLNPLMWERIRQEVRDVVPENAAELKLDTLRELRFLGHVVDEARRTTPGTVGFFGNVLRDFDVGGVHVPAGWKALGCFWTTLHDPHEWTIPWTFNPDRFEQGEPKSGDLVFVPHGRAHHRCSGMLLTEMMVKTLVVDMVLSGANWVLAPSQPFDSDWSMFNPVIRGGLKLHSFSRRSPLTLPH
eukprot:m51a1_g10270 cytochrome P450 (460) ;mRNA; r:41580-43507